LFLFFFDDIIVFVLTETTVRG